MDNKFDKLLYKAVESDTPKEEVVEWVCANFPMFDPDSDCYNDQYLSDYYLDKYAHSRSLGLPVVEVANSIELSAELFSKIYFGYRVSLDALIRLAKAEIFAIAQMKARCLDNLQSQGGLQATLAFLEKAFSDRYGDRKQIDINTGFAEHKEDKWELTIHHVDNKIKEKAAQRNVDSNDESVDE